MKDDILRLLQEIAPEIDPGAIDPDLPLRDQVDIDSMDFLAFIGRIYEVLGVNIPESDYGRLRSLSDLVNYVTERKKSS